MSILVLGGNKSGKSDFGLELLERADGPRTLIVTGKSRDLHFREQIMQHRRTRQATLQVVEVLTDLANALNELGQGGQNVLVDSLDFWMFSLMEREVELSLARKELVTALDGWKGQELILVSTEMGLGPLAFDGQVRAFARELGQINREIASTCASVYLVVAGLPHQLK